MTSTAPRRLRHFLPAALFIAAFALAQAGVANAEPREWDIDAYDRCMNDIAVRHPEYSYTTQNRVCCTTTGGEVSNLSLARCVAPPAEQVDSGPQVPAQEPPAEQQQGAPPVLSNPTTTTKPVPPILINPAPAQVG